MEGIEVFLKGVLENCGGKSQLYQQIQAILTPYVDEGNRRNREASCMQIPMFANLSLSFATFTT